VDDQEIGIEESSDEEWTEITSKKQHKVKAGSAHASPWACQDQAFGFEEKILIGLRSGKSTKRNASDLVQNLGTKFFLQKS